MISDIDFESIRPYQGDEIEVAKNRLCQSQEFLSLFSKITKIEADTIIRSLNQVQDRETFQQLFFGPVTQSLIHSTTDGVTVDGMEFVDKNNYYIFISNHRDIILDSAILNLLLRVHDKKYTRAAIGSNLLINEWVTDLVKLNSCFVIERDITVREMLKSSALRSKYIREVIKENKDSVWIAEREGRTKNGDDRTQPSLLKMLKMSGPTTFSENFKALHLMPLAISYEWEPCDMLKTQELYTRATGEYTKTPEADMQSMIIGLSSYKGKVHFSLAEITSAELEMLDTLPSNGERIEKLASIIDEKIHKNFKLWPNNYIAYDLLHATDQFAHLYSSEEKEHFKEVMNQKINKLEGDLSMLNQIYLDIYANPVKNKLSLDKLS